MPEFVLAVAQGQRPWLAERPHARLIYGGSAKPGLLRRLGSAVDGVFLGRFAHDVSALASVIEEAATSPRRSCTS